MSTKEDKKASSTHHAVNLQKHIQATFQLYAAKDKNMADEEWLNGYFAEQLPEMPEEERKVSSVAILTTIQDYNRKKEEICIAENKGMSRQGWLAQELDASLYTTTVANFGTYLSNIDDSIAKANEEFKRTIFNNDGTLNQNPNLDGFIFEAEAAGSFNMDAALKNKSARAEVLRPEQGQAYSANSADIAIKDPQGNTIKEIQAKCYSTAEKSNEAFNDGDYGNQERLVPKGHEQEGSTSTLSHDGVSSKPISKEDVKDKQKQAQEQGKIDGKSWNDYTTGELALQIGKQTALAGLYGAGLRAVFYTATKVVNDEKIDAKELAKESIQAGAQSAAVCAIAAALKVYVEKNMGSTVISLSEASIHTPLPLPCSPWQLPKNPHLLAAMACIAVDSAEIFWEVGNGKKTLKEGLYECERNAYATVAGLAGSVQGRVLGASIGALLGPMGASVGGLIGGIVGGMAGSTMGRTCAIGVQKVRDNICEGVKKSAAFVADGAKNTYCAIHSCILS